MDEKRASETEWILPSATQQKRQQPVFSNAEATTSRNEKTIKERLFDLDLIVNQRLREAGCKSVKVDLANCGAVQLKKNITFESKGATLNRASIPLLQEVALALKTIELSVEERGKDLGIPHFPQFECQGHTHAIKKKTAESKKAIQVSTQRAQLVRKFLVQEGVRASHLSCKGFGGAVPIPGASRETNRRVEIVML